MGRKLRSKAMWGMVFSLAMLLMSQASWAQLSKVRAGYMTIACYTQLYWGLEKGTFTAEGLAVEPITVPSSGRSLEALSGGSLEMGTATPLELALARDKGFDYVIVAPGCTSGTVRAPGVGPGYRDQSPIMVLEDSPIRTAKDLEGQPVGTHALYSINWLFTMDWVKKKGADPTKLNWIEVPFPQLDVALRTRRVVAVHITEPFATVSLRQGGVRAIDYPFTAHTPDLALGHPVTTEAILKKHPDMVRKFARAVNKAIVDMEGKPAERLEALRKYVKIDPELARAMVWPNWKPAIDLKSVQAYIDLAFEWKLIGKKMRAADLVYEAGR